MKHFFITHFAGCAVLLNKDTFHSDVQVNSVYIHDTRSKQQQFVKEGQSGWVLQDVISCASFRRIPRNGKSYFTMMSLHINNHYAKQRGIGKNSILAVRTVMRQEQVDMVAGDLNGAAWRRQSGSEQRPIPPGPTSLWRPGGCPGESADMCGFIKPTGSETAHARCVRNSSRNTQHQSYRPELPPQVWILLLHVNARLVDRTSRDGTYRRPTVRKRNSPYDQNKDKRQFR